MNMIDILMGLALIFGIIYVIAFTIWMLATFFIFYWNDKHKIR
jgi:hypothetical protein